ncbi:hypothetical protein LC613_32805 [Nostoc sphaeroides CHAB 2801]|uniref:hypothetical protein n=1 Tax=Nostoc sphaeroides TaxID=446679 RepID=UPI001E452C80|nr:hypothetical protein [Nostoc sphaeroides]MCC5632412.1 hypothetical protein [Nostoc sphaeroides CHAB 2801]
MAELIEKKQLNNIATWMIPIKETNLPSILKGVFFMDGNPLDKRFLNHYIAVCSSVRYKKNAGMI